jgi:hypothetical protein
MTLNSADEIRKLLKDGGRDRTRTCDLLRVKPVAGFFLALFFSILSFGFQQLGEPALRSTDNPNDLNRWGFDTVLIR